MDFKSGMWKTTSDKRLMKSGASLSESQGVALEVFISYMPSLQGTPK